MKQEEIKAPKTDQLPRSTARRDKLQEIEHEVQDFWRTGRTYEANPDPARKKFFLTFPYPYANGRLHLGHGYSFTKCDFTARYKRLMGYNVLMPFGFHVTGMPISAAAQRVKRELQQMESTGEEPTGQYKTLMQMGIAKEEISKFSDPYHWVHYFPPIGKEDLTRFGASIDWRRTFITTDANAYYNAFIEWHFTKLKAGGHIKFGKRPSIWSILDKQMCADHDRLDGEGVGPQEYALIKIKVLHPELISENLAGRNVFLVAATLRPETMYGQTNCFVLPTGEYGIYTMKNDELFVCSERSALNMAYQNLTKTDYQVELVQKVMGEKLIGLQLRAPLSQYEMVYALPMDSIKMDKGTGVVTSVPSDSPDDWATLRDLQKKPEYFKVQKEWTNFAPISIIDIPSYGGLSALAACEEFHVKSVKDVENIKKAKDKVYLLGFYEGVLLVGDYKGLKVQDAKPLVKRDLVQRGEALVYYEPENKVVSRTGDECIVALCDQWYLSYDDAGWKDLVRTHLQTNFTAYTDETQKALLDTVDWLREWGCSRSFGLGTKLPWDKTYLIESLSDSTVYMAYYTIAHYLQANFDGTERGTLDIGASQMSLETWDYIFLEVPYDATTMSVPQSKLDIMRNEFNYWYPMDLRCSGKDLIKNHLTMALFNHAAVWRNQPAKWPRSYFCNGYVNVDGEKMSKQKGNFKTIDELVRDVGADATRFGCAQAGDTLDDANFEMNLCDANILKISTLLMYVEKVAAQLPTYRTEAKDANVAFFDEVFANEIKNWQFETLKSYNEMKFRDVMKYGFFNLQASKDEYLLLTAAEGPRRDLLLRYIEVTLVLLHPILPHMTEHAYKTFFLKMVGSASSNYVSTLSDYLLPELSQKDINYKILREFKYYTDLCRSIRVSVDKFRTVKKGKQEVPPVQRVMLVVARDFAEWQKEVLVLLNSGVIDDKGVPQFDWKSTLKANVGKRTELVVQKQLQFANYVLNDYRTRGQEAIDPNISINEVELVERFKDNILKEFKLPELQIIDHLTAQESTNKYLSNAGQSSQPLKPTPLFE